MADDAAVLPLLKVCGDLGLLQLRDLYIEVRLLAGDRLFSTSELCAHASMPENWRLRVAIEAVCAEVSPRKLGKTLARFEGTDIDSMRADAIGADASGILWRVSPTKPTPDRTTIPPAGNVNALPPIV